MNAPVESFRSLPSLVKRSCPAQTHCLAHALAYAAQGLPVLPLAPAAKKPADDLVSHGFREASTDPDTIRRWFAARPDAGVGIVPGPARLLVLDLDDKPGKFRGVDSLEGLEARYGSLPVTLVQRTASGGEAQHRVFRLPAGVDPANIGNSALAPGIDVRCSAGYIAAEPTRLADGGMYTFDDWDVTAGEVPDIAEAPAWLLAELMRSALPTVTQWEEDVPPQVITPTQATELRSALTFLDPIPYESWVANGQRLKRLGNVGREMWMTWSAQSPNFDAAQAAAKWETFKGDRTGYAAVFADAQAGGWINPASNAARVRTVGDGSGDRAIAIMKLLQSAGQPLGRDEAVKRARDLLAPSMREREAPAYPVQALGPLAEACETIATEGQVQPAMAGQCLLGAASLLAQGLFNIETLTQPKPLSLYLLTLGDSGDGKSTAQGAALWPVQEWQRKASKQFSAALEEYSREKAKSRGKSKGEDLPEAPSSPYRLVADATVEGLRRDLDNGPCSQGVFSDEAAAILSGYGMSADHRSKTAGVFSKLWDDGHLSVSRATGPRVERYGCRLAMHWLIQPMAASESIGDPLLAALGFWPRFLAAWPAPADPRKARAFKAAALPAVARYWGRCRELLDEQLPDDASDCPLIELDSGARTLLHRAFEGFEVTARKGALRSVRPWGLRASEQACRVAGVLAAFAGVNTVTAMTMGNALALVSYSLDTWRAVVDEEVADQSAAQALRLYEWLTQRPGWCERLAKILHAGPAATRSKDRREAALGLLADHGLARVSVGVVQALVPPGDDN